MLILPNDWFDDDRVFATCICYSHVDCGLKPLVTIVQIKVSLVREMEASSQVPEIVKTTIPTRL